MKKIVFLTTLTMFLILSRIAYGITWSQLNKYAFASYTPSGFTGKTLYVFEDPLCPYCDKLNKHIVKYSNESGYRINFIFKIIHGRQAFDYAVKFVCGHLNIDNANFVKYTEMDYKGSYCSYGKNLVMDDLAVSNDLDINITPSFISNTGFRETGLSLKAVKKGLGIK